MLGMRQDEGFIWIAFNLICVWSGSGMRSWAARWCCWASRRRCCTRRRCACWACARIRFFHRGITSDHNVHVVRQWYEELGGEVVLLGKPAAVLHEEALRMLGLRKD